MLKSATTAAGEPAKLISIGFGGATPRLALNVTESGDSWMVEAGAASVTRTVIVSVTPGRLLARTAIVAVDVPSGSVPMAGVIVTVAGVEVGLTEAVSQPFPPD
jgi:hypothetical protein